MKVESNANQISIKVNRSLMAKQDAIFAAVNKFIKNTERDAKNNLSSNDSFYQGKLRGSFRKKGKILKKGGGYMKLIVDASYAPFVEFGTKGKANPPAALSSYAATFKGRKGEGGGKKVVGKRLRDYALSKNVPEEQIGAFIHSILKNGTKPHPFFFPAVFKNKHIMKSSLKRAIKATR
jgi:HK97 gp10 family phage protein